MHDHNKPPRPEYPSYVPTPYPPYGPTDRPPQAGPGVPPPPPPEFPPYAGPGMPPPIPNMPPVPSVVEGQSLYEAVNNLTRRVNVCINTYNDVIANSYETLRNMQRAAESNGAYYSKGEVWMEEGYNAEQGASYTLIHKATVDRRGEPIRIKLHLAYGNTTNSQVAQPIFDASEIELADKIVVAQPMQDGGWYGKAMIDGMPLPSADAPGLWTMGFTRGGAMRVYQNGVETRQMNCDEIEDAMGVSGVLIQNGQVLSGEYIASIPDYDKQTSRICVGQNTDTREVIFLVCGAVNDVNQQGMTSTACANILRDYGCTIAVELCEGNSVGVLDKGQALFHLPEETKQPEAFCYWYISRKRYYRNDFQPEIARLTQLYGRNQWTNWFNANGLKNLLAMLQAEITNRENGDDELKKLIEAETARAEQAETDLQTNINAETNRAEEAERLLQENINKEQERAEAAEAALAGNIVDSENTVKALIKAEQDRAEAAEASLGTQITESEARSKALIDAEQARAEKAESDLQTAIDDETIRAEKAEQDLSGEILKEKNRAVAAEGVLKNDIISEQNRAQLAETTLQEHIDQETARAEKAEGDLQSNINAEETRAMAAENELQTNINTEVNRAKAAEASLDDKIIAEANRAIAAEGALTTKLQDEISKVTLLYQQLTTQVTAMDNAIVAIEKSINEIQNTLNEIETNLNTVKELIANTQTQITNLTAKYDGIIDGTVRLPYVLKAGDSMTGTLSINTTSDSQVQLTSGTAGVQLRGGADNSLLVKNLGSNDLANVSGANPTQPYHLTTKQYVEAEMDAAVDSAKQYTDDMIDAMDALVDTKVNRGGDTMVGTLTGTINSPAFVLPVEKANSKASSSIRFLSTDPNYDLTYYTMYGSGGAIKIGQHEDTTESPTRITGLADPQLPNDAVNLQTLTSSIGAAVGGYVLKSGDEMLGTLTATTNSPGIKFPQQTYNPNVSVSARFYNSANHYITVYNNNGIFNVKGSDGVTESDARWEGVADGLTANEAVNLSQVNDMVIVVNWSSDEDEDPFTLNGTVTRIFPQDPAKITPYLQAGYDIIQCTAVLSYFTETTDAADVYTTLATYNRLGYATSNANYDIWFSGAVTAGKWGYYTLTPSIRSRVSTVRANCNFAIQYILAKKFLK